ncbi:nuclear transport factor 2 family protein [Sphingomonas sp. LaA6.9]|uniref:nuclear transport factor 2 family protein n=1 Tax=Sphingomonas sp. LaA6.9 TaxID=2919914 RepID=UPI001F4FC3A5|nr:nuclear transport factor 2 family protein [Sphingomonas sp. LaA6.9]MCJ8158626.1 nuclear transport factor 2 family protein [Sphingomonas sp. LaA6.9]
MRFLIPLLTAMLLVAPARAAADLDTATVQAIEAAARDYIDGQLDGDAARVKRGLHPDMAKRAIRPESAEEKFALRRMTTDELVELTQQGALKTPREQWDRTIRILDVAGNIATVRVEAPWFIDHLQLGNFNGRWMVVNALYYPKPNRPALSAAPTQR